MSHLLYRLYEQRLRRQMHAGPAANMSASFSMATGATRASKVSPIQVEPIEMGSQKLDEVLLWCNELGIPAVTLWVCSTENLKRSHAEVSEILGSGGGQDWSAD